MNRNYQSLIDNVDKEVSEVILKSLGPYRPDYFIVDDIIADTPGQKDFESVYDKMNEVWETIRRAQNKLLMDVLMAHLGRWPGEEDFKKLTIVERPNPYHDPKVESGILAYDGIPLGSIKYNYGTGAHPISIGFIPNKSPNR